MKVLIRSAFLIVLVSLLFACQSKTQKTNDAVTPATSTTPDPQPAPSPNPEKPVSPTLVSTECKSPRSPMCTRDYRPVCATRDTGVRCVTTPCPSTEKVTKSNACTACADEKVHSYTMGACGSGQ